MRWTPGRGTRCRRFWPAARSPPPNCLPLSGRWRLVRRLPPREPSLDLWREFAPRMAEFEAEMAATRTVGLWRRMRYNGHQLLSQFSAGLILWTHALATRTHARLERYLLHDPLTQSQHGDLGEIR